MLRFIVPRVFFFEFLEVGGVDFVFDYREEGGCFFSDSFPVDSLEEGVCFDFRDAVDAESFGLVCDESSDEVDRRLGEVGVGGDVEGLLPVDDFLAGGLRVVREEGGVADDHLEKDDADAPPVDCLGVALLREHLGRDVVRGADCRER